MRPKKPPAAVKLRNRRISIPAPARPLSRELQAPDERTAEAAAIAQFDLDQEERKRLAVREE
jgi:hypothetical protein